MKIAGTVARVTAGFDSTAHYFREFLTDEPAEFSITVTQEDMDYEQAYSIAEAHREGIRPRLYTGPHLERVAIQRGFAEYLLPRGGMLLHGSTVAVDGKAYLFTAQCGTGKSTHTRLWRQVFGQRAVMVNDDKPFLLFTQAGIFACGSPWSGKHGLHSNVCLPLQGICILERGVENVISPMAAADALPMLLHQAYEPKAAEQAATVQALVGQLSQQVPLWHLYCNQDHSAAQVAYDAMSQAGCSR